MNYPISANLRSAIQALFDDESIALGLLGEGVALSQQDVTCNPQMKPAQRLQLLCNKIESFIMQMANELSELGPDELPRLRAEATGMLVVLRELQSHFPEVIGDAENSEQGQSE